MTAHRHYVTGVDPRPPFTCECGATWDEAKNRWREPKARTEGGTAE